jgi:membrane protein
VDLQALRTRVDHLEQRLRELALRMLDIVPGLQRFVTELVRVEVIDRSMVIAAQGLLALVPLLIVMAAFLPHEVAVALSQRFQGATGLAPEETQSIRSALSPDQVRSEFGVLGALITLFSATSFARSIQRMNERTWELPHIGGVKGNRRCFVWLAGWLIMLQAIALLGLALRGVGPAGLLRLGEQCLTSTLLWWWSAHALLLGRKAWRRLLPGAAVTGIALTVYTSASKLVMPTYAKTSAEQLGTLGIVLAATTWLIGVGLVFVVAAVVGRVLAEDDRVHQAVRSLRVWRWWTRHQLDKQQHQSRDDKDHQGEGTRRVRGEHVDQQGDPEHGHP